MKNLFIKGIMYLLVASAVIPSTLTLSNKEIATKLEIETNLE